MLSIPVDAHAHVALHESFWPLPYAPLCVRGLSRLLLPVVDGERHSASDNRPRREPSSLLPAEPPVSQTPESLLARSVLSSPPTWVSHSLTASTHLPHSPLSSIAERAGTYFLFVLALRIGRK